MELLPVTEYPLDMSWGYQVTGYFAPTSRYGTPHDFMYLVDQLAPQAGIGVILDWVPSHFRRTPLASMNLTARPAMSTPICARASTWSGAPGCFDYGRNEVKSFLFSSAMYWLNEYHIDGLRVDAVASMLYLDYGRTRRKLDPQPVRRA